MQRRIKACATSLGKNVGILFGVGIGAFFIWQYSKLHYIGMARGLEYFSTLECVKAMRFLPIERVYRLQLGD